MRNKLYQRFSSSAILEFLSSWSIWYQYSFVKCYEKIKIYHFFFQIVSINENHTNKILNKN
jgi:hypothetical protein